MKIIKINTCRECPHIEYNNGGGYTSAFVLCKKYNIILEDWDSPMAEKIDYRKQIHPKCELENA